MNLFKAVFFYCLFTIVSFPAYSVTSTIAFDADIDTDILIDKVSHKHYRSPTEDEVGQHVQSLTDFERYLKTLDPYSKYVKAEKVEYVRHRRTLPRKGIGMDIIESNGKLLLLPLKKGALYRSGLKTPHYLKAINGNPIQFNDFDSYRFLSTMKLADKYSVAVIKNKFSTGSNYKVRVELTRRPLHYTYKKGKTVVLGIKEFSLDTKRYLHSFFEKNKKMKHLIIDLRHCIGGSPFFTADALSYFLEAEKKVVTYRSKSIKRDKKLFTAPVPHALKKSADITFLISEFTASSAELFVRALKHYRKNTTIIGKPSAGKCLAQKPFPLENNDVLVLSIYELITPDGKGCEGKPIAVDKVVNDIELMPISHILQTMASFSMIKD